MSPNSQRNNKATRCQGLFGTPFSPSTHRDKKTALTTGPGVIRLLQFFIVWGAVIKQTPGAPDVCDPFIFLGREGIVIYHKDFVMSMVNWALLS